MKCVTSKFVTVTIQQLPSSSQLFYPCVTAPPVDMVLYLILQKKDGRWHEVMVDLDYSPDAEHHLRFVLSQQTTTAAKLLLQVCLVPMPPVHLLYNLITIIVHL